MKKTTLPYFILIVLATCFHCKAQKSDFIVITSNDTIYVDKITMTDFEIKTKTPDKKKKYNMDDIISYYISKENKYYVRIPLEKKEIKAPEKYDYRRNENSYLEEYRNSIKYKYIERLTVGKVNLFVDEVYEPATGTPGQASAPGQAGYIAAHKNKTYYISIYDSKLEMISEFGKLLLTTDVYDIVKEYLNGNKEIEKRLDTLYKSRPFAEEKQIIDLINDYNSWVKSNK
ncbi:hypothetical protein [Flavobacterium sp. N1994]|uniref:hypothetical protein n=1 Tax=Flavobacterium sp. N1994 TaxID=2986827 RepID=UPI0022225808|nr:hypothetical protein [Flavobacterium sp. N1994]